MRSAKDKIHRNGIWDRRYVTGSGRLVIPISTACVDRLVWSLLGSCRTKTCVVTAASTPSKTGCPVANLSARHRNCHLLRSVAVVNGTGG
ncbi:hypothetical protein AURDEDRAFT_117885, partial [Auricularia subglabra TFB-10046 SS5]